MDINHILYFLAFRFLRKVSEKSIILHSLEAKKKKITLKYFYGDLMIVQRQ